MSYESARAFALSLAPALAEHHAGPHTPGTLVLDTDHDNALAYIVAIDETWATVVYIDEPDCQVAAGNHPGRWVATSPPCQNHSRAQPRKGA